jgi:hypothetical protein
VWLIFGLCLGLSFFLPLLRFVIGKPLPQQPFTVPSSLFGE